MGLGTDAQSRNRFGKGFQILEQENNFVGRKTLDKAKRCKMA